MEGQSLCLQYAPVGMSLHLKCNPERPYINGLFLNLSLLNLISLPLTPSQSAFNQCDAFMLIQERKSQHLKYTLSVLIIDYGLDKLCSSYNSWGKESKVK